MGIIAAAPGAIRTGLASIGAALAGLVLACLPAGGPALAAQGSTITIQLPGGQKVERMKVSYSCEGGLKVEAEYINFLPQGLATLSFKGQFLVMATVLSGSGAKYAALQYVWWTKGDKADLYDLTKGEGAAPVSCTSS